MTQILSATEARTSIGEVQKYLHQNSEGLNGDVHDKIKLTKEACLRIFIESSNEIYRKFGNIFPALFSERNKDHIYDTLKIFLTDFCPNKLTLPKNFLKNVQINENLLFQRIALNGFNSFDHHGINYDQSEVATTQVFRYLNSLEKLPDITVNTIKNITIQTKGTIDTDAIISNFALLYPKLALENEEILTQAALRGDLNINVSNEKSIILNHLITGLVFICMTLKKDFERYLKDFKKNVSNIMKPKSSKDINISEILAKLKQYFNNISYNNDNINNLIDEFEKEIGDDSSNLNEKLAIFNEKVLNEIDFDYDGSIQEFNNITGNAIINMVPDMLKYIKDQTLEGGKYDTMFRYAQNYFTEFVDNGTKSIEESIEKGGRISYKINGNTICFTTTIPLTYSGIPIESYFNFVRGNLDYTGIKYLIVNVTGKKPKVSISALAKNKNELGKIDIQGKLASIQGLQEEYYKSKIDKVYEEFVEFMYIISKIDKSKLTKEQLIKLENEYKNLLTILSSYKNNYKIVKKYVVDDYGNLVPIINNVSVVTKNPHQKINEVLEGIPDDVITDSLIIMKYDNQLLEILERLLNGDNTLKIKGFGLQEATRKLNDLRNNLRNLKANLTEGHNEGFFTYRTGLIIGNLKEIEKIIAILNEK